MRARATPAIASAILFAARPEFHLAARDEVHARIRVAAAFVPCCRDAPWYDGGSTGTSCRGSTDGWGLGCVPAQLDWRTLGTSTYWVETVQGSRDFGSSSNFVFSGTRGRVSASARCVSARHADRTCFRRTPCRETPFRNDLSPERPFGWLSKAVQAWSDVPVLRCRVAPCPNREMP